MAPYLYNGRRRPRLPLRIPVEIAVLGESWQAETEDLGPGGCLLSSPRPLVDRAQLKLVLRCEALGAPVELSGIVAWSRGCRGGVSFAERRIGPFVRPGSWFKRLLHAHPQLAAGMARAPDRLALDVPLYVRSVPRRIVDFSADERSLLRRALEGATAQDLLSSAAMPHGRAERALFGLFEKSALTLSMGQAGETWKWRSLLGDAERSSPCSAPTDPAAAAPAPAARPAPVAVPARVTVAASIAGPAPDEVTPHATLLRGVRAAHRSPAAQARLDEARAAASAARIDQAVALLRQALALAPRDAEISKLLGELAFKDRRVS